MSHDERGATLASPAQGRLDRLFGAAVERAGGLIEDQDAGIGHQGAGDPDPLPLTARQFQAALPHPRGHTFGQASDEVAQLSGLCRRPDRRIIGIGPRKGDVAADAIIEQSHVLRHQSDSTAQGRLLDLAKIETVQTNRANLRVDQAQG